MNCIDCRREMLIDPLHLSDSCEAHLQGCADCQREHQQLKALEHQLAGLRDVTPPPGLRERVLMQGHYRADQQRRRRHWALGLAASVLLGVGLLSQLQQSADPLASNVLAHVNDELHHLREVQQHSPATLKLLLAGLGGEYRDRGMRVNYAGHCQVRSGRGLHMVLRGEQGPVTVLVMPGEFVQKEIPVADQRFQGRIYSATYGSFAVVGEENEPLKPVAQLVRDSLSIQL